MIPIVTSFNPDRRAALHQIGCFETWASQGFDVVAVQGQGEIIPDRIASRRCRGVEVTRIDESGPPRLIHLLRKAATIEGAILLNSDLMMLPGFFEAIQSWMGQTWGETGCLWLRRWNIGQDVPVELASKMKATREQWGIDAFAVRPSSALLEFFDNLDLRIGRPGWDYVLPYWFKLRGLPLWTIDDPPLLLHRDHPIRWSQASWEQNTLIGAKALGLAPTVQLSHLSRQLNHDVDKYSKRLALPCWYVGQVDSTA